MRHVPRRYGNPLGFRWKEGGWDGQLVEYVQHTPRIISFSLGDISQRRGEACGKRVVPIMRGLRRRTNESDFHFCALLWEKCEGY